MLRSIQDELKKSRPNPGRYVYCFSEIYGTHICEANQMVAKSVVDAGAILLRLSARFAL